MADDLGSTSIEDLFAGALEEIRDQDVDRRPSNAVELHRRGTRDIFETAMRLTHSHDDGERELGIFVLRELGPSGPDGRRPYSAAAIPRLVELLRAEQDPHFERALLRALADNGAREALSEFTSRVGHQHVGVRQTVAFQLPSVIDEDNVDPAAAVALEVLSHDPDADTRYYALHALVAENLVLNPSWLEGIAARLVQDPDQQIRQLALRARPR